MHQAYVGYVYGDSCCGQRALYGVGLGGVPIFNVNKDGSTGGGRVVANPSGGLLSSGHPLGATGLAQCFELTDQLRGTASVRQVDGANITLQPNPGRGLRGNAVRTCPSPARRNDGRHARLVESGAPCAAQPGGSYGG